MRYAVSRSSVRHRFRGSGAAACGFGLAATLAACVPTGPEARRAAYVDCARKQGLTVEGGTIMTRGAADLARLDVCEAIPR